MNKIYNYENGVKVLSLFDGISCGMLALQRAGIPVKKYVAYEIEENALKISKHNWNNIEYCGDVIGADFSQYKGFDLLIGGSPCTYWSVAKGGKNRETFSSGLGWDLFSEYVRALREIKPKYFLYENNKSMSNAIKSEITKYLGVEPVLINSADFSAQERKRYYWTNIPIKKWQKSDLVFADIMDKTGFRTRSIAEYKDTYRWSKDGTQLQWDTSGKGYYSQQSRAKIINTKWNTVCASRAEDKGHAYIGNDTIRIITMNELEKLQTLPVGYTDCLTNKEMRGRCIGNGWTVDVIAHILKGITNE